MRLGDQLSTPIYSRLASRNKLIYINRWWAFAGWLLIINLFLRLHPLWVNYHPCPNLFPHRLELGATAASKGGGGGGIPKEKRGEILMPRDENTYVSLSTDPQLSNLYSVGSLLGYWANAFTNFDALNRLINFWRDNSEKNVETKSKVAERVYDVITKHLSDPDENTRWVNENHQVYIDNEQVKNRKLIFSTSGLQNVAEGHKALKSFYKNTYFAINELASKDPTVRNWVNSLKNQIMSGRVIVSPTGKQVSYNLYVEDKNQAWAYAVNIATLLFLESQVTYKIDGKDVPPDQLKIAFEIPKNN